MKGNMDSYSVEIWRHNNIIVLNNGVVDWYVYPAGQIQSCYVSVGGYQRVADHFLQIISYLFWQIS